MGSCFSQLRKPLCKSRSFKSKGGTLVLLWELCVLLVVFHYYHLFNQLLLSSSNSIAVIVAVSMGILMFTVSGLLGDVILGRYKTIKYSLFFLWVCVVIQSVVDIVLHIIDLDNSQAWSRASMMFILFGATCCGAILVNSMNFGIDQLMDAPSWQVSSYISWYCWCFFVPDVPNVLFIQCSYRLWKMISTGLMSLAVTIALCMDNLFGQTLVKEPRPANPIKLIYNVLKYAARNKYPHSRTAFSYWDEKKSRIDLSKTKYGGPFTFEEVEEVKAFFRVLGVIIIGTFFTGYFCIFAITETLMFYRFQDSNFNENIVDASSFRHCLVRQVFHQGASFLVVLGVPLFELFVYPLLRKYSMAATTTTKFKLGMILLLTSQLNYLALDIAGYTVTSKNITIPCLFNASEVDLIDGRTFSISFYWLGTPKLCSAGAYYLIFTSTSEFLYTQSPYSMKGLLMGLTCSFVALFIIINGGIRFLYEKFKWHNSCGTLYFLVSSVLTLVLIIVVCIISKWYAKRRWRDNNNEEEEGVSSLRIQHYGSTSMAECH